MFKIVMISLVTLLGTFAHAEPIKPPPRPKPGPVEEVKGVGLDALNVLGALVQKRDDNTMDFLAAGDEITGVSKQKLSAAVTTYSFTIRHVHIDTRLGVGKKVYLGGGTLTVKHRTLPTDSYETDLIFIKSGPPKAEKE